MMPRPLFKKTSQQTVPKNTGQPKSLSWTLINLITLSVLLALLLVDVSYERRYAISEHEQLSQMLHRKKLEYARLMTQYGVLSNPKRIEFIAHEQFNMHIPDNSHSHILH